MASPSGLYGAAPYKVADISLADFEVKGTEDTVGSKVGKTIKVQVRLRGVTGQ